MKLEHFAINVSDPRAFTKWYVSHMGLTVVKQMDQAPFTTFLADESGNVMIEIYNNPPDEIPPYKTMNPLLLHLAFVSSDPEADSKRLVHAGAEFIEEIRLDDGSFLIMMRDPWGLALQLCKRGKNMLKDY